ncbi:MAG: hypothetical protein HOP21_10650, partial [Methylotenera sp.]|nr:hypothetical protein [Methylotenera sp.]
MYYTSFYMTIRGSQMARIKGTSGNNSLVGTAGNDTLIGGSGNDNLSGGTGTDTAQYAGNIADYRFANVGGKLMIVGSTEGKDTLTSVEILQLGNGQLTVNSGEFQVNTYITSDQRGPSITALADGGFVVGWRSDGQDGSGDGIYAQRYDASGIAQGGEFQVNTYTMGEQTIPRITNLADGGFVVSWHSSQDGDGYGIYAQRYDASGTAQGGEFQVNTVTNLDQYQPSIAALPDGGFVLSWSSLEQDGSGYGVYAQRYDASGTALGGEFQVNTYTTVGQSISRTTDLANGGFVVTWTSDGQDGSGDGIYAQRYDASGVAQGLEFRVNTYTTSDQQIPSIAALVDGGFVVSWASDGQDGDLFGIYAQRYDASGAAQGVEFQVNTYFSSDQRGSSIAALADGGFVVSWRSEGQDGDGAGIYAQRYDAAGNAVGLKLTGTNNTEIINLDAGTAGLVVDGLA